MKNRLRPTLTRCTIAGRTRAGAPQSEGKVAHSTKVVPRETFEEHVSYLHSLAKKLLAEVELAWEAVNDKAYLCTCNEAAPKSSVVFSDGTTTTTDEFP